LIKDLAKVAKIATKQRPHIKGSIVEKITISKANAPIHVTIDDIDSFREVRNFDTVPSGDFTKLSEQTIKEGFQRIVKQEGIFKDWGGETNDLFTGKLKYRAGHRIPAAFAFKGKATKGARTPGKMGKHGDQIGRLFTGPAQICFVVYPRAIAESVINQMRAHAVARALGGEILGGRHAVAI
jgi:hypothetical protein